MTSVNGFCRICNTNLKVQYCPAVLTENFLKASNRKECKGLVLANTCNNIGLHFKNSPIFSQRICRSCGRKICNAVENYTLLKRCLENENVSSSQDSNFENPLPQDAYSPCRQKRSLPTTVTPDRCSSKKRDKTNKTPNRVCKKQLYRDTGMQSLWIRMMK